MPRRPARPCTQPGCPQLVPAGGRCEQHRRASDQARGTAAQRGYDHRWRQTRAAYLHRHPVCALCDMPATVADHWPHSRKELLHQAVPNPDADQHLRPLCATHHNRATAQRQPGGFQLT